MTPRERVLAAFGPEGTPEVGAVCSYLSLCVRDHWFDLTSVPWWLAGSGIVEHELAWRRDCIAQTALDWIPVSASPSRAERAARRYEQREDGTWRVDGVTGQRVKLDPPAPGGAASARDQAFDLAKLPTCRREMDAFIGPPDPFDAGRFRSEGRHDTAAAVRQSMDVFIYGNSPSPLWILYTLFGYEGMMLLIGTQPDLAAYGAQRLLQRSLARVRCLEALEVDGVWIEEALTDQINPDLFARINVPLMAALVREVRACGLKSIYYYCGNPFDRLESILQVGADAVHFEESKKGFSIDLDRVVDAVDGRCVVFGNLDSIGILENGSDDALRAGIERQILAGRRNRRRFVMSTGSPITPGTPVGRVRQYAGIVHEFGR